jgi:hypothetical protein
MKNGLTIYKNGAKRWYLSGKLHKTDGPAVEYVNGHKEWYLNGNLHREDGPAIELTDGDKLWLYNGENIENKFNVKITSVEQYEKLIQLMVFI